MSAAVPPAEPSAGSVAAVPAAVRAAGALVLVQGAAGVATAVVLVFRVVPGGAPAGPVLGLAAYFLLIGGGVATAGTALLRGRRWARTPALLVQLLLLGVAWYATVPSARPEYGGPLGGLCLLVGGLLVVGPTRRWAVQATVARERSIPDA